MPTLTQLSVAWSYAKKYAWIFFALLSFLFAYVLFAKQPGDLAKQLADIQKAHADELKKIQDADAARLAASEENQKKLEAALALLDEQHKQALAQLDAQQKAEVNRIVAQSGDDPQALAEDLAKQLGFQVGS